MAPLPQDWVTNNSKSKFKLFDLLSRTFDLRWPLITSNGLGTKISERLREERHFNVQVEYYQWRSKFEHFLPFFKNFWPLVTSNDLKLTIFERSKFDPKSPNLRNLTRNPKFTSQNFYRVLLIILSYCWSKSGQTIVNRKWAIKPEVDFFQNSYFKITISFKNQR